MKVKMKLLSDAIPGSGEGNPGLADTDISHDEFGLPIIPATRTRGILRESSRNSEEKDKLIQRFSHTLRSSLVAIDGAITNAVETGNTDRLISVQFDIKRIDKNLRLLSLSARNPRQLKAEIISSISETGYSLSEVFLASMIPPLLMVLNDPAFKEYVLKRYLIKNSEQPCYRERFSRISEEQKEMILKQWKKKKFWFDEKERDHIYSKKWETLTTEEFKEIYHKWLTEELIEELDNIRQQINRDELVQWINKNFMHIERRIESEPYFESEESQGAIFFSWIFSEIYLNCLKYGKALGLFRMSIKEESGTYSMCFENETTEESSFAPKSGEGLKVLRLLVKNMDGKFHHGKYESDNMYKVIIEIPKWKGDK